MGEGRGEGFAPANSGANLPGGEHPEIERLAEWNSAIQQSATLRYAFG
jgi:hypothetical protein